MTTPRANRPALPALYGVPVTEEGMLAWDEVTQRLEQARNTDWPPRDQTGDRMSSPFGGCG